MPRFRLGINYWPLSSAMAMWRRFDAVEVAEDFACIAEAGFDCVRVFLLWEDFQPEPERVSLERLADLVAVADAARREGLDLMPTLFTGHMSGVNWAPGWALDRGARPGRFRTVSSGRSVEAGLRNWYADGEVEAAQRRLAREAGAALAGHPALWAWDLGNEPSNCVRPPTARDGVGWIRRMTEALRGRAVLPPVTLGLHQEDLAEDRRLGPREAGPALDFACMHAYPAYARWARDAADDGVPVFLGLLTRWLSGREVLLAELGAPVRRSDLPDPAGPGLLDEEAAAAFTGRALEGLCGAAFLGALLWCFGDYDAALASEPPFDLAPHEMCFGLWRSDRTPKRAVAVVRAFGRRERPPPPRRLDWIDVSADEYLADPARHLGRLYEAFTARAPDHHGPGESPPGRDHGGGAE
jgi:endo-1,4-beta-mannosidase